MKAMEEVVEEKEVKPLTAEQLELYESQSESKSDDSVDEEEEDADEDDDADEGEEDDDDEEEDDDVSPRQTALGRLGWQESTGLELGPARARSPANAGLPPSGNQALFRSLSFEQLLPLELL